MVSPCERELTLLLVEAVQKPGVLCQHLRHAQEARSAFGLARRYLGQQHSLEKAAGRTS
jgi:hypothetical protein